MKMTASFLLGCFTTCMLAQLVYSCPKGCNCDSPGKVVCESLGLTSIPLDIPAHTKRLELFDNNIPILKNYEFANKGLNEVTELYLDNNNIETVEKDAFRGLPNLRKILIRYNKIKQIDPDLFQDSKNIKEIYLCGNDLIVPRHIPFLNAPTTQVLKLDSCAVYHIPRVMFLNTPNLKFLVIDNNGLETLDPGAFSKLKYLEYLSVAKNNLQTLPLSLLWKLQSLKQIQLTGNEFECNCQLKYVHEWLNERNIKQIKGTCASPSKFEGLNWPDILGKMDCSAGSNEGKLDVENKKTTTTEPNDHAEVGNDDLEDGNSGNEANDENEENVNNNENNKEPETFVPNVYNKVKPERISNQETVNTHQRNNYPQRYNYQQGYNFPQENTFQQGYNNFPQRINFPERKNYQDPQRMCLSWGPEGCTFMRSISYQSY